MNTHVPNIVSPSDIRTLKLKAREFYCRVMKGDGWHMALKTLTSPRDFSKTHFWETWRRAVINCCKPLPVRSSATEIRTWWGKSVHGSDQISRSVVSDSLRPHESQHARPHCPSPTPGVYSKSCASRRWCHPTISSSVVPFSSCLQSFPASGSFQISQFFASGGQSESFSFNISPFNEHSGLISFRMDWLDLLVVQGTLKSLL